jgi:hypothetical protein
MVASRARSILHQEKQVIGVAHTHVGGDGAFDHLPSGQVTRSASFPVGVQPYVDVDMLNADVTNQQPCSKAERS